MTGLWRVLAVAAVVAPATAAASAPEWNTAQPVFRSSGRVGAPVLLVDSSGTAHLLFAEAPGADGGGQLIYMRREASGWTDPAAVFAPGGTVEFPSAAIDSHGWLHVSYAGPMYTKLEYRRVPLAQATDPTAWSRPQLLSEAGAFHSQLTAVGDALHLVYSLQDGDVVYRRSDDRGRSWSDGVVVSALDHAQRAAQMPHIAVDDRGRLHVVWTEFELPKGWPPLGVFYGRSTNGGKTWSPPREMAGLNRAMISVAARGDDEVDVAWNAVVDVGDRDHAFSADGGDTWSAPDELSPQVRGGLTGPPTMVFDSAGVLHEITSVSGGNPVERIVELARSDTQWSEPALVSGATKAQRSVEWPMVALSGGNQLRVAYEVDYKQIWYNDHVIGAPAVAPQPVPTMGTDLGSRLTESTRWFRVLVAVLAVLIVSVPIEFAWRRVHWRTR